MLPVRFQDAAGAVVQVSLNEHPSLLALLHAQSRGMEQAINEIKALEAEIEELEERASLLEKLGQQTRGTRQRTTMRRRQIDRVRQRLAAYESNYIEVPNPAGDAVSVSGTATDMGHWMWGEELPPDTPLDVLRALNHAKEQGLFEEFRIMLPKGKVKVDPMIYGVAGGACFYVAGWR